MPRPSKKPACSVIMEDGRPCGRRPSTGNPPQCAECIADIQSQDTAAFLEDLGARAEGVFEKLASGIDRIATVFEKVKRTMPAYAPKPPFQRQGHAPAPPPPRSAPPPPPKPSPEAQKQAALKIFGWQSSFRYTAEDVKKRKHALARVYHTDAVGPGGDASMMQKINRAADILMAALK